VEKMDKFLVIYNLPGVNDKEVKKYDRTKTSRVIKSVIKTTTNTKAQDQMISL
jgi:hypothetical protein